MSVERSSIKTGTDSGPMAGVGILTSHPEAVEGVWPMSRHCLDAYILFEAKMQAKWAKSPGRFNARGMLCVVGAVMGKKGGPMLVT